MRPGKGTRPRTRRRPAHSDASEGFVVSIDRGRYGCLAGEHMVTAMKARELGRRSVAVGDRVLLAGDVSGAPDTLARIVRIQPRTSALRRSPDDSDPVERVIVANAELLVIVSALAQPAPHLGFVDRCLVAAYDAGITPLLCLTKADLAPPDEVLSIYAPLGVEAHVTQRPLTADQLAGLQEVLDGKISVMIGQSGVGKSTLVNALVPDADRVTGIVNPVTGRGRTRRRRRWRYRCRAAAGSSTPPACAASVSATSLRSGWWRRSPTWPRAPRAARPAATTWDRTAAWTPGPPSTGPKPGWTRCGGC